ncbi:U1 small nuclear ribonucleoprotein A, putative [Plasmodium chabaudi chabaudi]|uniref:U1 small nuclear ribonucleoprotein A, putative n=1 Tax=Plasmodium chabaudi chabaudi TaxID=31271 RepID=A0A1C6YR58_PLACU|nr:U1 small nuclear ribonucleoprotein A, putative [Plasmodium chabaudi chabaudi]
MSSNDSLNETCSNDNDKENAPNSDDNNLNDQNEDKDNTNNENSTDINNSEQNNNNGKLNNTGNSKWGYDIPPPPDSSTYPSENNNKMMNNAKGIYNPYPQNMNIPMNMFPNADGTTNNLPLGMYQNAHNMLYNPMNYMNSKAYLKLMKYNKVITADPSIPPNETLYVKNLNDKIKCEDMKKSLKNIFNQYGLIEDIIVMKSFWRKGQAWIVYDTIESSTKALNALQGFVLFGKIMQINYSHNKSDVHTKRNGTFVERSKEPKKPKQIIERERKQKEIFEKMQQNYFEMQMNQIKAMHNDALDKNKNFDLSQMDKEALIARAQQKANEEKKRKKGEDPLQNNLNYNIPNIHHPQFYAMNAFAQIQANPVIPYRILFVENVDENVNTEAFNDIFKAFSGFVEARIIPQRNVAFVDYTDESSATSAMKALQDYELQGSKLKISYAKR